MQDLYKRVHGIFILFDMAFIYNKSVKTNSNLLIITIYN